jgi:hypothetical protein
MIGTEQYEITAYLYAVRAALGDLPESTRDELLEDLPEHLAEVLAEAGGTLVERLGPPEVYAAELRASAGFVGGFPDPPPRSDRAAELRGALLGRLRTVDERTGPLFGYQRASDFIKLLRPAWWVLRGYLAAMVLARLLDDSGQPMGLLPRIGGSEVVALLLLAVAVLGSIWLGRRSFTSATRWPRYALYAGTTVLVLVAIGGFFSADSSTRGAGYADVNYDTPSPFGDVRDIFVYDDQGRLVPGARLFDQNGSPIQIGNPYCMDGATGEYVQTEQKGYPYCSEKAPFRAPAAVPPVPTGPSAPIAPSAERTAQPSPSASPNATSVPTLPGARSAPR